MRRGVSLLEMSVVIALTAILATGAVVTYDEITRQSRITQNISNLDELDKAFRMYQSTLELIPNQLDSLHEDSTLTANLHVDLKTELGFDGPAQNLSRVVDIENSAAGNITASQIQMLKDSGLTHLTTQVPGGTVVQEISDLNTPEIAVATIRSRSGDVQWEAMVLGIAPQTATESDFIAQLPVFPESIQEGIYSNYIVLVAITEQDVDANGAVTGVKRDLSKPRIVKMLDPKGRELVNGQLIDANGQAL